MRIQYRLLTKHRCVDTQISNTFIQLPYETRHRTSATYNIHRVVCPCFLGTKHTNINFLEAYSNRYHNHDLPNPNPNSNPKSLCHKIEWFTLWGFSFCPHKKGKSPQHQCVTYVSTMLPKHVYEHTNTAASDDTFKCCFSFDLSHTENTADAKLMPQLDLHKKRASCKYVSVYILAEK